MAGIRVSRKYARGSIARNTDSTSRCSASLSFFIFGAQSGAPVTLRGSRGMLSTKESSKRGAFAAGSAGAGGGKTSSSPTSLAASESESLSSVGAADSSVRALVGGAGGARALAAAGVTSTGERGEASWTLGADCDVAAVADPAAGGVGGIVVEGLYTGR